MTGNSGIFSFMIVTLLLVVADQAVVVVYVVCNQLCYCKAYRQTAFSPSFVKSGLSVNVCWLRSTPGITSYLLYN